MMIRPTGSHVVFGAGQVPPASADSVKETIRQTLSAKGYKIAATFDDYVNDPSNQVVIGSRNLGINPAAGPTLIMVNMRPRNPDKKHTELKTLVKTLSQIPGASRFTALPHARYPQYSGTINKQMVDVSELDTNP